MLHRRGRNTTMASFPKRQAGRVVQVSHDYGAALQDEADGRLVQQRMKVRT